MESARSVKGSIRNDTRSLPPHVIIQSSHRDFSSSRLKKMEKQMLILDGRMAKSYCRRVSAAILEKQNLPHTYLISDEAKQMPPKEKL